ncbi:WXG100 family type VII secretion target [Micromonospora echinofusca]|uniref:ESAT-6-like protein n=1 Tax=Micromonospora echinofusca TaxID=47858 RepID=A0ABS3VRY6_MICEH|nr:WXG100 family type VII secretion target [Micromonospora echinofusca]MBO4207307.1 WXG100 family type VII secretion target [Micromonospora echinofusca]
MVDYMVNHGGVDNLYAELNRRTQEVRALLADLERTSRTALASWEGEAQRAYYAAKAEWDSAANTMSGMLASKSQALTGINQGYQDADRQCAGQFR